MVLVTNHHLPRWTLTVYHFQRVTGNSGLETVSSNWERRSIVSVGRGRLLSSILQPLIVTLPSPLISKRVTRDIIQDKALLDTSLLNTIHHSGWSKINSTNRLTLTSFKTTLRSYRRISLEIFRLACLVNRTTSLPTLLPTLHRIS